MNLRWIDICISKFRPQSNNFYHIFRLDQLVLSRILLGDHRTPPQLILEKNNKECIFSTSSYTVFGWLYPVEPYPSPVGHL